ncbi:RNA polymerase sigma factor [Pinibacter aurantiacus]|uniref:RNA polymerase sigma-70 factor n=1 Tax=Pinibacter aurantiacus TaxID=2851599 RepID=A0A9E2SCD6_9BACT|nr:RNA polymerase sigma-70 factor [Pinibacter aurantiacus]MBV4360503.1 RNA polymerase sigma-70 factor [Pinibacter aurantiacus]
MNREDCHIEPLLLQELAQGSSSAFDKLYYRYYEPVRLNILKIVRDETVADDILQEVFISLWQKREKFSSYEKIGGWLFVTSYNRSLNYLRNLSAERLRQKTAKIVDISRDWPLENSSQEMQLQLLEEAIAQLPPQRRRVFELCRFEGKSYDEAATELSISKNTVKEHLVRSKESILSYVHHQRPQNQKITALALAFVFENCFF